MLKQPHIRAALIVVAVVVVAALLSKWTASSSPKYSKRFMKQVHNLVKQSQTWHATAKQDGNPIISLLHADYALAYARIARSLAGDKDIERISGVAVDELLFYLEEDQQQAIQALAQKCPSVKPEGMYAVGSGWV